MAVGSGRSGVKHSWYVSEKLGCCGFLTFVYDGDYWGYEFFNKGQVLDHFVQDMDQGSSWFPNDLCLGNAQTVVEHLPHLDPEVYQRYLVRYPTDSEVEAKREKVNTGMRAEDEIFAYFQLRGERDVMAQPNDEFSPFDSCFVLDFMRYLGVKVELQNNHITFLSSKRKTFWISERNTFEKKYPRWLIG